MQIPTRSNSIATKQYGNRVKSLNMTLQHVAIPFKERAGDVSTLSGFMATWIDFLLLARSEVLVHSWYVLPSIKTILHTKVFQNTIAGQI